MSETDQDGDNATDATSTIKIQGIYVDVKAPYAEGHVLTAPEAQALNQTRAENVRNNAASRVRKAREELNKLLKELGEPELDEKAELPNEVLEKLIQDIQTYDESYTFASRGTRQPIDPVAREAHKIAAASIRAALSAKGIDLKTLPEGKLEELVQSLLAKRPEITEEAARRIAAAKAVGEETLKTLGL